MVGIEEFLKDVKLDQVCDIHGHLVNLGTIVLLDITEDFEVVVADKVDGDTLAAKTTRTTDTVDVQLSVIRQVIVYDQGNLLDIDTTGPHIRGNDDTTVHY